MDGRPMDRRRGHLYRLHIDPFLLWGVLILSAIGLAVLYSATGQDLGATARKARNAASGMGIMLVVASWRARYFLMWARVVIRCRPLAPLAVAIAGTARARSAGWI